MARKQVRRGRKEGSRNKGYFHRTGRGWYATDGERKVRLLDDAGNHIKDRNASTDLIQAAYARYVLAKGDPVKASDSDSITVAETCELYLAHCESNGAASTFSNRAGILFDFCKGLPAGLRNKPADESRRIHKGYGSLPVKDLIPLHIDQWIAAHKSWDGCKRTKVQAVKRALNYGVGAGFLSRNPIKGYKVAKSNIRKTYLTPEQEEECYKYAKPDLAMAIQVCIRTGARYGCELAKLTAKHVRETDKGMTWTFSAAESKARKQRVIRITDPEIIEIVRRQIVQHPTGPIFRNSKGTPWVRSSLGTAFTTLRKRLARKGVELDQDACMYSTRHTYAKRALQGFWTGKPTTIENLSRLMGNSRQVCWEVYSEWCGTYEDPLWESA